MTKKRVFRMSGPAVVIGFILLVPSILGILFGGLTMLVMVVGSAAAPSTIDTQTQEVKTRLISLQIPNDIVADVVAGKHVEETRLSVLTYPQRSAVRESELTISAAKAAPGLAACCGGGFSAMIMIGSFVGGLLGWLLIMRKMVLQCFRCGATPGPVSTIRVLLESHVAFLRKRAGSGSLLLTGRMAWAAKSLCLLKRHPRPCGYFGDLKRECRCGPVQVQRYRQRISGPLLDRIDLHIEVPAVEYRDISSTRTEEASAAIRDRVQRAREKQHARFHSDAKVNCNARMGPRQIKQHCKLSDESQDLIRVAMTELNLSARAYDRILKVSRTVADLANSDSITPEHVSEAIQYRTFDRTLWV